MAALKPDFAADRLRPRRRQQQDDSRVCSAAPHMLRAFSDDDDYRPEATCSSGLHVAVTRDQ